MSSLQCPTTIILARHGEATYESPTWQPEGGCLTPAGRAQAGALAERLAGRRIAHVWTSTLARAVQTAEIAAARLGVSVTTRAGLREFEVGDAAGTPLDEDPFADTYARWLEGELDERIAGGESATEIVGRMSAVLDEIADQHPGETVLVISHGGALRLAVPHWARLEAPPQRLTNCATLEVRADPDDRACVAWDRPA
ncbi:histidine phosphatase family protein [Nocardioides sp. GXZ039]|uniref:histidine phosphatase family protein n=1 Tax=Nocardioides sp. GXZ039 TaxID=3136018 RepID=UPI0030F47FED